MRPLGFDVYVSISRRWFMLFFCASLSTVNSLTFVDGSTLLWMVAGVLTHSFHEIHPHSLVEETLCCYSLDCGGLDLWDLGQAKESYL